MSDFGLDHTELCLNNQTHLAPPDGGGISNRPFIKNSINRLIKFYISATLRIR